jgi:hypothetical protein
MLFFLYDYFLVTRFLWEIFFVVGNCLLIMQCKERRQDIGRGAHEALKTTSSKFSFLLFCKFSLSLSLSFVVVFTNLMKVSPQYYILLSSVFLFFRCFVSRNQRNWIA